jgi:RNA polymerase sigma-70 factor (ECF subfamily)
LNRDEERQVVAGLRAGDRDAWLRLYDAYAERLWQHVARLSGGRSDAVADVLQSTLLAAAQSARTFDPDRGTLWLWLCGVARNQLALFFRRSGTRRQAGDSPGDTAAANTWQRWTTGAIDDPSVQLGSQELADLVRRGLANLSEDYQTILLARHVDGHTAERIASDTGTTGQAVRAKLVRARLALQQQLSRLAPSLAAKDGGIHDHSS